jgi:hypothetical protein
MGERTDALHIFTNNSGNYNKLSNGEPIGESIVSDLRQYFITLFKNDYRYNYYNWEKLEVIVKPNDRCYYNLDNDNDFKIKSKIKKYISVEGKKDDRIEIPEDLLNSVSNINYIRDDSYTKGKYPYLQVDNKFYIPDITINDNYSEKALLIVDLLKLNELFKSNNYKNIDDIFLLDFYKEFKYKIDTLKNKIISDDDDIKKSIKEDIFDKLKIIYKIDKKSGPKKDTTDKLIETIIEDRAKKMANLNLIKNYNEKVGGGKSVSIKDLDGTLLNIYQSINNIKRIEIQLNEYDVNILSTIKYLINEDSKSEDYTFKISKDKDNNSPGSGSIEDTNCNNTQNITKIIKDNSIKKYKKYLALIYFFSNDRIIDTSTSNQKTIGGAEPVYQQILNPVNLQRPQQQELQQPLPIKYNIENSEYTAKNEQKKNISYAEKADSKDISFQTNKILADLKDTYIDLAKIYKFIAISKSKVIEYADALINEIIKSEDEESSDNFESLKNAIKTEEATEKAAEKAAKAAKAEKAAKEKVAKEKAATENSTKIQEQKKSIDTREKYKAEENIKNLKNYIDIIKGKKEELITSLKKLDNKLNELKKIPYATEYIDHINTIKNTFKLEYVKEKTNSNNCKIIKEIDDYISELDITYNKFQQQQNINSKSTNYNSLPSEQASNIDKENINTSDEISNKIKGKRLEQLEKIIDYNEDFVIIINLLKETNYNENIINDGKNFKKKRVDNNGEELLYETLWDDYNRGISITNKVSNRGSQYFTYLNEGEKLKNSIILNDLDPEIVLKVTIQDKAVFLLLIFIIRTICIVIIELLIEYNMLKSLQSSIVAYTLLYLTILLLFIIFINLDSYKLRIIFNYLNMHANTSNVIIHIVLFSIFSFLVIIIIQTDNFINNVIDIFDYTYIYNYLFDFSFGKAFNSEFENNISPDEKIKLLYRLDIVSMIIFIFTGILVILI